jgi:hypothetical protein
VADLVAYLFPWNFKTPWFIYHLSSSSIRMHSLRSEV